MRYGPLEGSGSIELWGSVYVVVVVDIESWKEMVEARKVMARQRENDEYLIVRVSVLG